MSDPKEKIAAWMRQEFESNIWSVLGMSIGDSPIENVLICAVYAVVEARSHILPSFNSGEKQEMPEVAAKRISEQRGEDFIYQTQAHIEKYRADFLFVYNDYEAGIRQLVVECDGHDFHERTKDQAAHDRARDRRLQELGYTVYRFTGSEIYRDPIRCALQIVNWAWGGA